MRIIRYFEVRKLKQQKKLEAEFDREYKKIMKEIYAETKNYNAHRV